MSREEERAELAAAYAVVTTDAYGRRWDLSNPGNAAALDERQQVLGRLCARYVADRPLWVLDLGCGPLSFIPDQIVVDRHIGADLLLERLGAVRVSDPSATIINADGVELPFPNAVFDVVVLSTLMSSVLNETTRRDIAREGARVLKGGGIILWYDFRLPSASNRATRPVRRAELVELFPEFTAACSSLTLLPPLARRLGRHTMWAYPLLTRVPLLRSHLAACLIKPSS